MVPMPIDEIESVPEEEADRNYESPKRNSTNLSGILSSDSGSAQHKGRNCQC